MAGVFTWVSIFAIGAMIVNSIGIWFVYKNIEWAEKNKELFMCFAAGVLISSPLLIAFPQAIEKNSNAGIAALLGFAFLVAALTTPVGAFISYPFVSLMNDSLLGLALGFVVGILIYLSASHLLPEAREYEKKHVYWAFLTGILLGLFIYASKK